jgi:hypothetical protein
VLDAPPFVLATVLYTSMAVPTANEFFGEQVAASFMTNGRFRTLREHETIAAFAAQIHAAAA